jgi:16S rRNA (guanine966-N2)-methyltransferase
MGTASPGSRTRRTGAPARGRDSRRLRIIGGQWRGRKFRFPPLDIRPTPDRVRETLFNWLQSRITGARCLDLYAGSGALGLEALSRGAAAVVFVEQQRATARALEVLLRDWQATDWTVLAEPARQALATGPTALIPPFDVVFLDPPYDSGELAQASLVLERGWLSPDCRIYVEHARSSVLPTLPATWRELRAGTAGEVGYHLFERTSPAS